MKRVSLLMFAVVLSSLFFGSLQYPQVHAQQMNAFAIDSTPSTPQEMKATIQFMIQNADTGVKQLSTLEEVTRRDNPAILSCIADSLEQLKALHNLMSKDNSEFEVAMQSGNTTAMTLTYERIKSSYNQMVDLVSNAPGCENKTAKDKTTSVNPISTYATKILGAPKAQQLGEAIGSGIEKIQALGKYLLGAVQAIADLVHSYLPAKTPN